MEETNEFEMNGIQTEIPRIFLKELNEQKSVSVSNEDYNQMMNLAENIIVSCNGILHYLTLTNMRH